MTDASTTVWCASFPKSGNTWIRALFAGIMGDGSVRLNNLAGHSSGNDQRAIFREFGITPSVLDDRLADSLMNEVGASVALHSREPVFRKTHNSFCGERPRESATHCAPRVGRSTSCATLGPSPCRWRTTWGTRKVRPSTLWRRGPSMRRRNSPSKARLRRPSKIVIACADVRSRSTGELVDERDVLDGSDGDSGLDHSLRGPPRRHSRYRERPCRVAGI